MDILYKYNNKLIIGYNNNNNNKKYRYGSY